jgi:outer membrane protein assembly factor BamC
MIAKRLKHSVWLVASVVAVTGCGLLPTMDDVAPDNTQKYRRAETMPPLDVPPDLSVSRINDEIAGSSTASSATFSEFEEAAKNPLAARYNITPASRPALAGEDATRHLVVPGEREVTWQRIEAFWDSRDLEIRRKDQRIGLMETVPDMDDYAYRLRMERGDVNRSARVYIAGRDDSNRNAQKDEAMLRQLADYLGVLYQQDQQRVAQQQPQRSTEAAASVTLLDEAGGYQALVVQQEYSTVWDRVGRVLDSRGFRVEDRDRSRGIYFVRYIDPFLEAERDEPGFFGRMAFWRSAPERTPEEYYNIKLVSDAETTRITILDAEETRSSSDTASRLLGLIQEQLTL